MTKVVSYHAWRTGCWCELELGGRLFLVWGKFIQLARGVMVTRLIRRTVLNMEMTFLDELGLICLLYSSIYVLNFHLVVYERLHAESLHCSRIVNIVKMSLHSLLI